MTNEVDYETAIFIVDCREVAVDGTISRNQMIRCFWESAPELKKFLLEKKRTEQDLYRKFDEETAQLLADTLKKNGVIVRGY